jgi:hypothetical protein
MGFIKAKGIMRISPLDTTPDAPEDATVLETLEDRGFELDSPSAKIVVRTATLSYELSEGSSVAWS